MCDCPRVYERKTVRCRRPRRCCECYGIIRAGELYERHSGLWDEWASYSHCSDCAAIYDKVFEKMGPYDTLYYGGLQEAVFEGRDRTLMAEYVEALKRRIPTAVRPWMLKLLPDTPADSGE